MKRNTIHTDSGDLRVFICSPYSGKDYYEMKANTLDAILYCKYAFSRNASPFCSHLLYPRILNDNNPDERLLGLSTGIKYLEVCDEIWCFVKDGYISEGMRLEIDAAKKQGMRIGKEIKVFKVASDLENSYSFPRLDEETKAALQEHIRKNTKR